jgi:hypothetical protein
MRQSNFSFIDQLHSYSAFRIFYAFTLQTARFSAVHSPTGEADAQALTFNKMAPIALGRIDIQYRRVECTVPQDLNVIIDENRGAGGWIRLQVKVSIIALT